MTNIDDSYTFFLKVFFKGVVKPVFIKVRKKISERFKDILTDYRESTSLPHFFICETIDGKYVGINLVKIQAVNVLWEPTPYFEDLVHYEGSIKLLLQDREEFLETYTEKPDELCNLYTSLEYQPDIGYSFSSFLDSDGEELYINIKELLYIESPSSLVDEGWEMVNKRDDIDENNML